MLLKKFVSPRKKGIYGEDMAAAYLKRKWYKISERNYRNKFGEIDIIARIRDTVVFVEVKSRSSDDFGAPSEAVDKRRQGRMCRAAQFYMLGKSQELQVRFDVIEVCLQNGKINHYENAFCFMEDSHDYR